MEQLRERYTMVELYEAFEVSSSGFYKWRGAEMGPREQENRRLVKEMRAIHEDRHLRVYGGPRMTLELKERGSSCSENRVAALMSREGLTARGRRPFKPKTTQRDSLAKAAPNRLAKASPTQAPGEVLVSDITYVASKEGWLYLAVVIDLGSSSKIGDMRPPIKNGHHVPNWNLDRIEWLPGEPVAEQARLSGRGGTRAGSVRAAAPAVEAPGSTARGATGAA
jgi:hypothetical protein